MRSKLVYVMGDSAWNVQRVVGLARLELAGNRHVLFAHRYVTNSSGPCLESDVVLAAAEFATRCDAGLMALHWRNEEFACGIGTEVEHWLARGMTVAVVGASTNLERAGARFPDLVPVMIEESPDGIPGGFARNVISRDSGSASLALEERAVRIRVESGDPGMAGASLADLILSQRAPPSWLSPRVLAWIHSPA